MCSSGGLGEFLRVREYWLIRDGDRLRNCAVVLLTSSQASIYQLFHGMGESVGLIRCVRFVDRYRRGVILDAELFWR